MTGNQNSREDRAAPRGVFILDVVRAADGAVLEHYEDHNLIVNLGREALAKLLGGGATAVLEKIAVGTNGADPLLPDTAITGGMSKLLQSITYPVVGTVQCDWSLETSEGNGLAIREFGLLLDDASLFARKTRAVINKDNTFRLEGTWKIIF